MTRRSIQFFFAAAVLAGTVSFPGCGGGGGEATYEGGSAQTAEEIQEAEDYMESLEQQAQQRQR